MPKSKIKSKEKRISKVKHRIPSKKSKGSEIVNSPHAIAFDRSGVRFIVLDERGKRESTGSFRYNQFKPESYYIIDDSIKRQLILENKGTEYYYYRNTKPFKKKIKVIETDSNMIITEV